MCGYITFILQFKLFILFNSENTYKDLRLIRVTPWGSSCYSLGLVVLLLGASLFLGG